MEINGNMTLDLLKGRQDKLVLFGPPAFTVSSSDHRKGRVLLHRQVDVLPAELAEVPKH